MMSQNQSNKMPEKQNKEASGGSAERLPDPLTRIFGQPVGDVRSLFDLAKAKAKGFAKRLGVHFLILIASAALAQGADSFGQFVFFYFGGICLFPRGFSLKRNEYLFPAVSSLGQLGIMLLLGYHPALSVLWAGAQSWVQRAVIRRFSLGLEWLVAPFLVGFCVQAFRTYDLPLGLILLTAACGIGGYYLAEQLDRRKRAALEVLARAKAEAALPFAHFYESVEEFEEKALLLPEALLPHAQAIVLHGRNILLCMSKDSADVQPGTRFLDRYLTAAHKIADDYIRLSREGQGHQDIEKVLGRVDEIMDRLARAFEEEHAGLLRNDAMQLGAELKVLDKLLKMEGR